MSYECAERDVLVCAGTLLGELPRNSTTNLWKQA